MRRNPTTVLALSALLAIGAVALAGQEFTLKRVAKVGDVIKMKMSVDAEFAGTPIKVTATSIDKVIKIDENGNITTESTQTNMKIKFGDQEFDQESDSPRVYVSKPNGEIVEIKGDGVDNGYWRMANMNVFRMPDKPVKVGDKWTFEIAKDSKTGAVAAKHEYEVLGVEKVGRFECLKIKNTFKETEGSEPASSTATLWVDLVDGSLVKAEASQNKVPIPEAPAPMDMKITLEREG